MKKRSKMKWMILICVGVVLIAAGAFAQCTATGYRMTVPLRGFDEVAKNVYVDRTYAGDAGAIPALHAEASARLNVFWGSTESTPVVIISDNERTIQKLGGDHDTMVLVLFCAHSYISVSAEYLNVDILAHEMTHAELYERLYKGRILPKTLIPTWFDEGVATQNDDRPQYSEATWRESTNDGENTIPLEEMDTAAKFYAGDADDRRFRYLISRHEVRTWIARNGMESLLSLIEEVNQGGDFYTLYHAE